ncbi:MAG: ATP-binding protein [Clostridia bacterium]|nr:ATP-binding protein [Clostridia bacterium]
MITRKIDKELERFYNSENNKALLITGARQVGKTYSIREFGKSHYESFVELNFLENKDARDLFENASDSRDLLMRLSAITGEQMIPGKTLIFFDEVQAAKEIVTAIKFLVEDNSYRYILSGSMLGVELKDLRSVPVGYMEIAEMYPLDFEEFALANGVSKRVIDALRDAFINRRPIDPVVHNKMMSLFELYLIVGGMPAAVEKYLETNNLSEVLREQRSIMELYKLDISQYDPDHKLYIEEIFDLIPSELNSQNKRFILKNLNENLKFSRYENSFIWLKDAGVALPTFCASEPRVPLKISQSTNLFKLFLSDVGLLASTYMNNIQVKILNHEKDINFGAIYENAVAQELKAHGFDLYYFRSKKQGELDFIVEKDGEVLPIEVKSGKDYKKHAALSNVMANDDYKIPIAYVFHNGNVEQTDRVIYLPVYMLMFLAQEKEMGEMIYKIDLDGLE